MTLDEIVVLARESGFETELFNSIDGDEVVVGHIIITDLLAAFVKLIAEKEREKEREACAKVCEETTAAWTEHLYNDACVDCAEAIRARGQK